jgi:aminoglycoside phosphotransferase (APT) family kinase protein/8-oxo-dGTP pyrophosphatase MutT (NUDIX family)
MANPHLADTKHHYAGVLLVTNDGKIIGQLRDDKPGIDNPGKIGTFGGTVEPGEDYRYAAWRELVKEETNLKRNEDALTLFFEDTAWRELTNELEARHFYYVLIHTDELESLEIYEGQGWAEIQGADDPRLIDLWRPVIQKFVDFQAGQRFQQLIEKIYPGATLNSHGKLEGGISAQVFVIEVTMPDGQSKKLVVRQYGNANLQADPKAATHEFTLLHYLKTKNLPVPEPLYADESCTILPSPYVVVEFIDGKTIEEPRDAIDFVHQMADTLAEIHKIDIAATELPSFLHNQQQVFTTKLSSQPPQLDKSLSEDRIRGALAEHWPPTQENKSVLLHGDFWPGNTMWKNDKLIGVIDWEDAGIGDPLADLGNGRLEILMFFGVDAMEEFTVRYKAVMPDLNYDNLPFWDLCAALRPAGKMASWGLDEETFRKLQAGHKKFTDQAIAHLPAKSQSKS